MRLCGHLWRYWQIRGHLREGSRYTEAILGLGESRAHPRERELALEGAGGLAYWQADMSATTRFYVEAAELARGCNDKSRIANALYNLSFTGWASGSSELDWEHRRTTESFRRRRDILEEALTLARDAADRMTTGRVLWGLAMVHYENGDVRGAVPILFEAQKLFREIGDLFDLAWTLHSLGLAHIRVGDLVAARGALEEQLRLLAEVRDVPGIAVALSDYADLTMAEGDRAGAIKLKAASAALRSSRAR
jgi:tetratricopeptide (TPR) repeat protein